MLISCRGKEPLFSVDRGASSAATIKINTGLSKKIKTTTLNDSVLSLLDTYPTAEMPAHPCLLLHYMLPRCP